MGKYILIIATVSFLIYGNSLNNEFVSDDIPAIVNNPAISCVFCHLDTVSVTESLNYLFGKFNPFIYHLTNVFFHALNSILVFFFLTLFFKKKAGFWASLVFVCHPVHTEAVTWISGRGYLFVTFFLLFSFLFYVWATSLPKLKLSGFISSAAFYIAALSSGVLGLLYPGMLALYDFTFRKYKEKWKYWIPFIVIAVFKLSMMGGNIRQRIDTVSADIGGRGNSNVVFNAAVSIFSHFKLLLWPEKLTLYHEGFSISPFVLGLEIFFLGLIILSLPLLFRKVKVLFFAVCFFILFLAPTYSPVTISWLVAERYLYLPSLSFSIFSAFLVEKYAVTKKAEKIVAGILMVILIAYSLRIVIRNRDWRSHASIWRATVAVSPRSSRAHNNMGDVYCKEGNLPKAVQAFKQAIKLKPNYADAYHNLANTYQKMDKLEEAVINYKQAIRFNPNLYQSYRNLGVIYLNKNDINSARDYFEKSLELNPDDSQVNNVLKYLKIRMDN